MAIHENVEAVHTHTHTHTSKFIKMNKGGNTFICDKIKEAHNHTI